MPPAGQCLEDIVDPRRIAPLSTSTPFSWRMIFFVAARIDNEHNKSGLRVRHGPADIRRDALPRVSSLLVCETPPIAAPETLLDLQHISIEATGYRKDTRRVQPDTNVLSTKPINGRECHRFVTVETSVTALRPVVSALIVRRHG